MIGHAAALIGLCLAIVIGGLLVLIVMGVGAITPRDGDE